MRRGPEGLDIQIQNQPRLMDFTNRLHCWYDYMGPKLEAPMPRFQAQQGLPWIECMPHCTVGTSRERAMRLLSCTQDVNDHRKFTENVREKLPFEPFKVDEISLWEDGNEYRTTLQRHIS